MKRSVKYFKFGYVGRCQGYRVSQAYIQGEPFYEEGTSMFGVVMYPSVDDRWVVLELYFYNPTSINQKQQEMYMLKRDSLVDLPKDVVDNMDAAFDLRDKKIENHSIG